MTQSILEKLRKRLDSFTISDYHGLKNQGATCYLNSVLQVLFMTEDFREAMKGCCGQDSATIDPHLGRLFADLEKCTADTRNITKVLGITKVYEQCDAAEYFERILSLTSPEASQIFKGQMRHRNTCCICHKHSDLDSFFWSLPLSVKDSCHPAYSVGTQFKEFFMPAKISGDDRMYCDQCHRKVDATIEWKITHHPEILTLLLKRFEFDFDHMCYVKLNCCVDVPQTIQTENCTYNLYAFINHFGSLKGGHNTAIIKSYETAEWYDFSDTTVTKAKLLFEPGGTDIKSRAAYLLMYRKVKRLQSEIIKEAEKEPHFAKTDAVAEGRCDLTEGREANYLKDDSFDGGKSLRQKCGGDDMMVMKRHGEESVDREPEEQPKQDGGEVAAPVRPCDEVQPHRATETAGLPDRLEKGLYLKTQKSSVQTIVKQIISKMATDVQMLREIDIAKPGKGEEQIDHEEHQKGNEPKRQKHEPASKEHIFPLNRRGSHVVHYEKRAAADMAEQNPYSQKNSITTEVISSLAWERQNGSVAKKERMYCAARNITDSNVTGRNNELAGNNAVKSKTEHIAEASIEEMCVRQGGEGDITVHQGDVDAKHSSHTSCSTSTRQCLTRDALVSKKEPVRSSCSPVLLRKSNCSMREGGKMQYGPTAGPGCLSDPSRNGMKNLRKHKMEVQRRVEEKKPPWK